MSLFAHTINNNSKLVFTLFSVICGILVVFAVCSNNDVYVQQSYSQVPAQTPLSQLLQQTNTTDTNVPIVLRPLPGGTCPQGYHLVSGTVCIKDLPSAAPTKTTPTIPATTTTNTTNAFSTPLSPTTQPNDTNPSNNKENFGTKILKSFNQEFK